ncbi:hypothetical protein [Desulfonatronum parangueonense]
MDIANEKHVVPKKEGLGESSHEGMGKFPTNTSMERGTHHRHAESWDKSEKHIGDAYEKTGRAMSQMYDRAVNYSGEHPGKAVLIAVGMGVGLGFIWGASARRYRKNQFIEPITYALSDVVQKVLR